MNVKRILVGSFVTALLIVGISVYAQVNRPYHNGSVCNFVARKKELADGGPTTLSATTSFSNGG